MSMGAQEQPARENATYDASLGCLSKEAGRKKSDTPAKKAIAGRSSGKARRIQKGKTG
jgi:hypothetical protein